MNALVALTLANIRSYVRDRAALFWTLAFPLIFIVMFGFIFQGGGAAPRPSAGSTRTASAAADRNCGPRSTHQDGIEPDGHRRERRARPDARRQGRRGHRRAGRLRHGRRRPRPPARCPDHVVVYTDPSRSTLVGVVYQAVGSVLGVVNLGGRPPLVVPKPRRSRPRT